MEYNCLFDFRFKYTPMPQQCEIRAISHSSFAIKPASHTTEHHSSSCLLSHNQDRSTSTYHTPCQRDESPKHCQAGYSGFNDEMRVAVAQPSKMHTEFGQFETWRTKIDEVVGRPIVHNTYLK